MLLLNFVRVLITLLGLLVVDAFRTAYGMQGFPLLLLVCAGLFVVFVAGDVAEAKLLAFFNPDDDDDARSVA